MRVKASVQEQKEHKLWGRQHPAIIVGVTAPQAEVNPLHTFVSQLAMQHAVCCHPCRQSPLTSRLKAKLNFNLLKNVPLAKASCSSMTLQSYPVLGFAGQDTENRTEMKPAVRGLRGLKVRMKCLRGVIDAPLKFEQ